MLADFVYIEAAMVQAIGSSALKQRLESQCFVVPPLASKAVTAFVKSKLECWTKTIKTAGIKAEQADHIGGNAKAH